MNFTAEQLEENYKKFLTYIDKYITGERQDKLKQLYLDHAERIMLMPAASVDHHHNAFPGGYVDHVIRVVHCALKTKALWQEMKATIDFTDEELVFAALNHDLGKIGFRGSPNYIPQTDKWRQDKLGELYTPNKDLSFMLIQDRSLFILQQHSIQMNEKEYLAIKLHDGLYDDVNKPYYITFNPDSKLRSNITYILHQADFLASKIELDAWKGATKPAVEKTQTSTGKRVNASEGLANLINKI